MKESTVIWKTFEGPTLAPKKYGWPKGILTPSPPRLSERLPLEIEMLLPRSAGSDRWRQVFRKIVPHHPGMAVGSFLGDPLLKVSAMSAALKDVGVTHICNLPSVAQYDMDFQSTIQDVGLGYEYEFERMTALIENGLIGIATVSTPEHAVLAYEAGASALFVVPQVKDYVAGFPSALQRSTTIARVRDVLGADDLPIFTLVEAAECERHILWPPGADGVIVRPEMLSSG